MVVINNQSVSIDKVNGYWVPNLGLSEISIQGTYRSTLDKTVFDELKQIDSAWKKIKRLDESNAVLETEVIENAIVNAIDDDLIFAQNYTIYLMSDTSIIPTLNVKCALDVSAQVGLITNDLHEKSQRLFDLENEVIPNATVSEDGLMSSEDKSVLDELVNTGGEVNVIEQINDYVPDVNKKVTIPVASDTDNGLMSSADKIHLGNVGGTLIWSGSEVLNNAEYITIPTTLKTDYDFIIVDTTMGAVVFDEFSYSSTFMVTKKVILAYFVVDYTLLLSDGYLKAYISYIRWEGSGITNTGFDSDVDGIRIYKITGYKL